MVGAPRSPRAALCRPRRACAATARAARAADRAARRALRIPVAAERARAARRVPLAGAWPPAGAGACAQTLTELRSSCTASLPGHVAVTHNEVRPRASWQARCASTHMRRSPRRSSEKDGSRPPLSTATGCMRGAGGPERVGEEHAGGDAGAPLRPDLGPGAAPGAVFARARARLACCPSMRIRPCEAALRARGYPTGTSALTLHRNPSKAMRHAHARAGAGGRGRPAHAGRPVAALAAGRRVAGPAPVQRERGREHRLRPAREVAGARPLTR
jgi:hypothetical protein